MHVIRYAVIVLCLASVDAAAQVRDPAGSARPAAGVQRDSTFNADVKLSREGLLFTPCADAGIRRLRCLDPSFSGFALTQQPRAEFDTRAAQGSPARGERSVTRKILGAAVGATAGFFGGGYLGAAIEGDRCECDDPGLMGAVIGAPIGGVAGGILGWHFLF